MIKTAEVHEVAAHFTDWLRQVAEGHEVIITERSHPLARLVAAESSPRKHSSPLDVPPLRGAKVLTPNISSAEIAEEMWGRE